MDLRLYFKKRKVAASSSANPEISAVEGEGDRQENTMEIVAGTSASPEIVELQVAEGDRLELTVEEGRSERPEEISECTEEVWGTDDQEEIVLEGKEKGSEARNRKVSRSDSSKHLVHYNEAWEREFSWLVSKKEGDKVIGMLCRLCMKQKCTAKYNHSNVRSETPCICIRKDSVRRHSLSMQHKEATEKEVCREQSARDGGIQQMFQKQETLIAVYIHGFNLIKNRRISV